MDTIRIKLVNDNSEYKLCDVSPSHFVAISTEDYDDYKSENGMVDLTDFNSDLTDYINLVVENNNGRVLKFICVYDSDKL
jgi:hypothetical protein